MPLSENDLNILLQAARDGNTSVFRDIMERQDGSGAALKKFFDGHSLSACEKEPPHLHMKSFVAMVAAIFEGGQNNINELQKALDYFESCKGDLKSKHDATLNKFKIIELPRNLPEPIASLLSLLFGRKFNDGAVGVSPRGNQYIIRVVENEVVVQGDDQPPDDVLDQLLLSHVPNYSRSNYNIRRLKADGTPFEPMMPGLDFSVEEKIELPQTELAESFSEMMERIKSMKKN